MSDDKRRNVPERDDNYTHNIHRSNERSLDRRAFMKTVLGGVGLFAVSTLPWGTLAAKQLLAPGSGKYPRKKIVEAEAVKTGEAVEFFYPSDYEGALLVRVGEDEWRAYQNACTHLKCPVFWSTEKNELLCPCHHGKFDVMTGEPLAGPPRRALPEIELEIEGGSIYAIGVKPYET
ncbi:Rieske 2Fe-2S domain-containing protein [Brevibacillus borstelensis]|jgi:nitrite reductase/ring-hydroxylating ferredoxin subunit|uniref:Rieske 2Fe-2S domain-containing protein n=2 Tax=Brevibacillus borstelensis TaxID=45462 RepID=UPI00046AA288|nr:Rieske 2Fe-2S domain-containing protein [Brevibacillus borstelensis]MBE5396348.1 Rieske 2Fe-2S domain-containing protein [Brevibacillus borstelensis]MCC0567124.1 Rieske 2Fe-2S domain-containing protein [Brevibacillus borstelensis]MCM3472175.1 Rieske 2Fe-2S domain-containing protein [Brevibacillus borstelensis]MCM3625319.1 Rieske 2Fe-2S domain-containing protein [Brevibacillus borstelensis]MED1743854.1 Rieske 2Fe-2S domain-containing protein [Brevibacillus borstelensis]